jgi:cytochrome P450
MTYRDWEIPVGSTVSMSSPDVLLDPVIFVEPLKFVPERWLGEQGRQLDKYNVIFARGARMCLGMWIAMAEMYFTVAVLASRFDFRLAEGTDESAIKLERDFITPFPEPGKEGVWVTIAKRVMEA